MSNDKAKQKNENGNWKKKLIKYHKNLILAFQSFTELLLVFVNFFFLSICVSVFHLHRFYNFIYPCSNMYNFFCKSTTRFYFIIVEMMRYWYIDFEITDLISYYLILPDYLFVCARVKVLIFYVDFFFYWAIQLFLFIKYTPLYLDGFSCSK